MIRYLITFFFFSYYLLACTGTSQIDDIVTVPKVTDKDKIYTDVYKSLDGIWKGRFEIYEDPNPKLIGTQDLEHLTLDQVKAAHLKKVNEIEVTQEYTSTTRFFQKVKITDYYPSSGKSEVSHGINKVQDGQMWCVVRKPSETVIHKGSLRGDNTIIWQSYQAHTDNVEFFQEEVTLHSYEIIGYGYYDGDDREKTPRLWFYGLYNKQ